MRALLLALTLIACDEPRGEARQGSERRTDEPPAPVEADDVSAYFPLSPGDRWRIGGSDETVRLEGVTGVDERGIAVIHGPGHLHTERYLASDEGVFAVSPEGRRLSPILKPPLRTDARFTYTLEERDVEVRCEVDVGAVDARAEVGGRTLSPCVSLTRRCLYPAGAPFPTETTHTRDEVYCRGVGLVSERGVFRPAPSPGAMAADRSERLVGFRVADGPEPPNGGCARYILLPSDVGAACGPDVRASEAPDGVGKETEAGGCRYVLSHGTAVLVAVVGDPAAEAPDDALVKVAEGARGAWLEGPPEACRAPTRLSPLLSSLLR